MKRPDGYYWVQIHPLYAGTNEPVWVVCLYREINGKSFWLSPGLAEPLTDDHFKEISPAPLSHPIPQSSVIWTPA